MLINVAVIVLFLNLLVGLAVGECRKRALLGAVLGLIYGPLGIIILLMLYPKTDQ